MMKIKNTFAAVVAVSSILAGCSDPEISEKKVLETDINVAMDARDAKNPIFEQALELENWLALEMLGQIGGIGCEKIAPYINSENAEARMAAQTGAAYCFGEGVTAALIARLEATEEQAEKNKILKALSFSSDPVVTAILLGQFDPKNSASVYALMQKITYDQMQATELGALPFDAILAETKNSETGFANAYFLVRLQGLDQVYTLDAVTKAIAEVEDQAIKKLLVRILPQFGNAAANTLLELAEGTSGPSQIEAVRSMGGLSDKATKAYLVALVAETNGLTKQLAVTALAGRSLEDEGVTTLLVEETTSDDVAVAAAALQGLMQRSPTLGLERAVAALSSDKYYLVNRAITLLASDEEGRSVLAKFAEDNAGTQRAVDAEQALDLATAALGAARPTPSAETVAQYQSAKLKLITSRGDITIEMLPEAAYAATSFLQLADAGKMDGMLWHRVIPNFVAQAGQTEDISVNDWGTIREEWFAADHKIGTVGLATIGKDTGSAQFFINTAYNLHLNGRYTVFGEVTEGLNVAMALREGDLIVKAEVISSAD